MPAISSRLPRPRTDAVSPWAILAAACLAAFAINIDTTVVNVALPSLTRQLGASTGQLQWIVDGYNLAFAALVLAAGSLGDRYGRRPALIAGLLGFAMSSAFGALSTSAGELIAARVLMGTSAALIFPTTLSIITNAFPDRGRRAQAIGIWGAVTGLGVAVGPVTGGLLLTQFAWPSVFVALIPVALAAAAIAWLIVPESRDPSTPPIDRVGLLTATAGVSSLVYTIIEAPGRGWLSPLSVAGFAVAAILTAVFVRVEQRQAHPMLDVSLFGERAFSAASGSVTIAFFALFGFIFLITQYMQFIRNYGPLSTGLRILPVALSIGGASVAGTALSTRVGTRRVVMTGLALLGASFLWIAQAGTTTSYLIVVVQMLMMGTGLGLTTAPATESILSVLPAAKAGIGSAVNDATRETGGTLGVAIIGSVYTSLYGSRLIHGAVAGLPTHLREVARSSVGAGYAVAGHVPAALHPAVLHGVQSAFMAGLHAGCFVAAGVCALGVVGASVLPGRAAQLSPAVAAVTA